MRPVFSSINLAASDADGISLSQSPTGAGNLTITGALASGGVATLDHQRQVLLTFAASEAARTFTLYGTDENEYVISASIAGAAATATSILHYKTVTRVAINGASAGAITVGTNGVGSTMPIPIDQHLSPTDVALYVEILTGVTVNCTVQYTPDDIWTAGNYKTSTGIIWTNHSTLQALTASADSSVAYLPAAVRLKINSGTGAAKLIVRQAGLRG